MGHQRGKSLSGIETINLNQSMINNNFIGPKKLNNTTPKQTDEFVDNFISHHIPCILVHPRYESDKIMLYFHANAEDISHSEVFCSEIKAKFNVKFLNL